MGQRTGSLVLLGFLTGLVGSISYGSGDGSNRGLVVGGFLQRECSSAVVFGFPGDCGPGLVEGWRCVCVSLA
jgi:hypothetical protein